jgi:(2Fe-2S) ferredoxin
LKRRVRVSKSGCLGFCKNGPHVLIMPDNIWLSQVSEENIEDILALALKDIDEI